ncbi:Uncharacterised protein [Burkholderia pseudomallei]|nr:Uncharacterised protein [Burkholderia pseudomallei]VCC74945.1 Uncharacterised protein [Burkholderia pseudomallei]
MPSTISEQRRADGLHPTTTRLPPRLRLDSDSIPVQCQLDSGVIERAPGTPIEPAHRTRPSASHDPVYGESAGPSNAPFSTPPKHRPAPRFAPRPLPISTEHCVGNRRQAAEPDDAKFVAR